jgi:hypothetical protein
MGLFKTFQRYKQILQILFVINIFFIVCGVVAVVQYAGTHEISLLAFVVIGLGTLLFGILVPVYIIGKISAVMEDMRIEVEKGAARLIAGWMENYQASDDALRDPHFWLNITLILVEVFGPQIRHPVGKIIADFAPLMKSEIAKPNGKPNGRKTAPKKTI